MASVVVRALPLPVVLSLTPTCVRVPLLFQEPHPDLLGSLLAESGPTHARRMIMSLAIYVALLFLFVWLPAVLLKRANPGAFPVTLRLCYLLPQVKALQIV